MFRNTSAQPTPRPRTATLTRTLFMMSDDVPDTIRIEHTKAKKRKRKTANHDRDIHEPVRKAARLQPRIDTFYKTPRRPAKQAKSISSGKANQFAQRTPQVIAKQLRAPLKELDSKQWQMALRRPMAWIQLPSCSPDFLSEYSGSKTHPPSNQAMDHPSSEDKAPCVGRRPRRQVTRRACEEIRMFSGTSDEELADNAHAPKRSRARSKRKSKSRRDESMESDFELEIGVEDGSDEGTSSLGNLSDDDDSSIATPELSEDETMVKKGKNKIRNTKAKTKQTTIDGRALLPAKPAKSSIRATGKNMTNLLSRPKGQPKGLDTSLPPLSAIDEIFSDLTRRALKLGLEQAIHHLHGRSLRVATMCSGTESPLLALEMIKDSFKEIDPNLKLEIQHLFSAEIVPFKQAYIERNFHPPIIFRDITELTKAMEDDEPMATTAYGGRVAVPRNVDIVIAGTSCVDFSRLNNRNKGLEDGGESADTWHAVLAYCRVFRPAIVLLENVKNAAWDTMLSDYDKIGYQSAGVHVDTKDYYIPHTRQRGYMACFDKTRQKTSEAARTWTTTMGKLKRPASAPASSFLLPNDQVARQQLRVDEPTHEVDWSQCEIRQMEYRRERKLGYARPITHWSGSGSILVPDHTYATWYQKQVERVLDTIDAASLRKALPSSDGQGMYDARFKTRIWDLSQNVDRDEDRKPFGIVGCITPSGQFFISDAGRAMTPTETLKFQGLPVDKISFTTEAPRDVQDLAGNAMSTTVIGSAILSALIAGFASFDHGSFALSQEKIDPHQPPFCLAPIESDPISATRPGNVDVAALSRQAASAMRRCYCEGPLGVAEKPIQACTDCGHTTCIECGGNPLHRYGQSRSMPRSSPATFKDYLMSQLPLRLEISSSFINLFPLPAKDQGLASLYHDAVRATAGVVYSMQHVRRTHHWTVTYRTSAGAELVLVFEEGKHAEWRLFARPDRSLSSDHSLRQLLQQPVAVCQLSGSLLKGQWKVRVPGRRTTTLAITGSGRQIASWWARNEMPTFQDHSLWEQLHVKVATGASDTLESMLSGTYHYLPQCGTACDGLYQKEDKDSPMYLFLDPSRTGEAKDDCFVFSDCKSRLESDQVRPVVARIAASWRPWPQNAEKRAIPPKSKADLTLDDVWHKHQSQPDEDYLCVASIEPDIRVEPHMTARNSHCDRPVTLMTTTLLASSFRSAQNRRSDSHFIADNAWIFEDMKRCLPPESWSDLVCERPQCESCAPIRPVTRWQLLGGSLVPYEDPSSAATYERSIKSRPEAIVLSLRPVDDTTTELALGANLATLAHRAGARLSHVSDLEYRWRLVTSSQQTSARFLFKPFRLSPTSGLDPYNGELRMSVSLFPKQQLALAWMRRQEQGLTFALEETEEATVPSLGWRVEVQATVKQTVRGGICADHPGFGKTITSLALIQSQLQEMSETEILADLQSRQDEGLIATKATLIICSSSLLGQWAAEIEEKTNLRPVVTIKTVLDLSKISIDDVKSAAIVLVSRSIFGSDAYAERLGAFAGVPGAATKSGRAFTQWHDFATSQIPAHLRILEQDGIKSLQHHLKETYAEHLQSETFKASVPSKRLRGKDYVAAKSAPISRLTATAAEALDTKSVHVPLLEMFFWNRLVVDEFHLCEPKPFAAIVALKVDKRWGLSATPRLRDLYDVSKIARLVGVVLPIGSDARGIMRKDNSDELRGEMTSFERFDIMRQAQSEAMHSRIYNLDQRFLDAFARQNIMDFNQMPYQDHLVPVPLDLPHRVLYAELSQHLNSLEMRIKKKAKTKATNRQRRFTAAVELSETAEIALSKAAAFSQCESWSAEDLDEVESITRKLARAIVQAQAKEPTVFGNWKKTRLEDRTIGDGATIATISGIIKDNKGTGIPSEGSSGDETNTATGSRASTAALNTLCTRLLVANRSARYVQNVQKIQKSFPSVARTCDNKDCTQASSDCEVAVSAFCGHVVCRECYNESRSRAIMSCPAEDCESTMEVFNLLWSSKLGDLRNPSTSPFGAKIRAAMDLLEKIRDKGEQAILFVQYDSQLNEIESALQERNILAAVVTSPAEAGPQIDAFRHSASTSKKKTVIVLDASGETAAGLNLQNANHVIFLSPLLRDTQYGYDSTMAQAIGRVRRHGQKRPIHVYRLVALDTIDVDILEHRERRTDALTEHGAAGRLVRPDNAPAGAEKERTQLVKENGRFSLRPRSWLINDAEGMVMSKSRVSGWEDFSSLVKFSKAFTENDD